MPDWFKDWLAGLSADKALELRSWFMLSSGYEDEICAQVDAILDPIISRSQSGCAICNNVHEDIQP